MPLWPNSLRQNKMQIHNLTSGNKKKSKTVGRGGKRGKTSGRGGKGQTARAGHRVRPEVRDLIKKLPKLRGYNAPTIRAKISNTNLDKLSKRFEDGTTVTPASLGKKKVKILSTGELTKKLTFEGFLYTKAAREKIEKAGAKII